MLGVFRKLRLKKSKYSELPEAFIEEKKLSPLKLRCDILKKKIIYC